MADRNTEEISSDSTGERTRRQRRTLPKPLLRLLLILAAIIVVVVVVVVVVTNALHSGQAADYQRYMTSIATILGKSDKTGSDLMTLLTNPGDTNRTQIQSQLDKFAADAQQQEVDAKALKAPKDLVDQSVHQMFLLVMSFRQKGVSELKPAIMNALDVQDTTVPVEQISHALTYLVNSDFIYNEVFVTKATALLQDKQLTGVTVPSTKFVPDTQITAPANVLNILIGLKSTGDRLAIHGVALTKVVAMPDEKELTAGGTFNLTSSSDLIFVLTVENQGNMEEKNVPVLVTLQAAGSTTPQKVQVQIQQIKPKSETTIEVKGINPTAYGTVSTLKIKVGPVQDEKYQENNSLSAKVIFKL